MSNGKTATATKPATNAPAAVKPANETKATAPADLPVGYSVGKNGKVVRNLTRFVSTKVPGFRAMVWADLVAKYGNPKDPSGAEMVVGKAPSGGGGFASAEAKEARAKAKAEEKAKFDAMTDEQKLAFAAQKREKLAKERNAKKEAEKQALIESIKADLKAGKIKL